MQYTFLVILLCNSLTLSAQVESMAERIAFARNILKEGEQTKDSAKIAEGHYLLGKRMFDTNNIQEAYFHYFQALKIYEHLQDHYRIGRLYLRLAELEYDQGNIEGAEDFYKESNATFSRNNLKEHIGKAPFWIEVTQNKSMSPSTLDSALRQFKKREQNGLQTNNLMEVALAHFLLGSVYATAQDQRAISYFESAVNYQKKNHKLRPAIRYRLSLADAYLHREQFAKAKAILIESQQIIDDGHPQPPNLISMHYNTYGKYYTAVKDWENASKTKDSAAVYQQSLINSDRIGNLSRWRAHFETEKKDLELKLHAQEIDNSEKLIRSQQKFLGLLLVLFALLGVLSYYLYKIYKKQTALAHKNAVLVQEQNHRVKNNLQVISSLLNLQVDYLHDLDSQKVFRESQTRIDSMVLLHRQLYENEKVEFINIENLLQDVANSVSMTFGNPFQDLQTEMQITELKTDLATSLGLIFNELLINSFKYTYSKTPPRLKLCSWYENNILHFTYEDYGKIDLNPYFSNPIKKGFGLTLIEMILFQINGTLTYHFDTTSRISIHLPLEL